CARSSRANLVRLRLPPPEMPRVLIAGCGYVGSAAARLFSEEGWEVIGWTRSEQSAECAGESAISLCALDITDLETVRRNRFAADVVVHCASSGSDSYLHVYRDGATNLATCFPNARIFFTSRVRKRVVYGDGTG